jgi:O-antigen/teichoic acid export membrane protein
MSRNETQQDSALKKEIVSIGKHSSIYVVGQALSRAVGFFMIPVYTRYIAPSNYGAMELIEILTSILLLTISIGASDGMSRYYYGEKDLARRNRVVSTVIIGFALIAIPFVALFWFGAELISSLVLDETKYTYILQLSFITAWFGMLCDVGYSYLRMIYRAKLFVLMTTMQLVLALSLNIWFVVFLRLNILGIFYSTLIAQGVIGLILAVGILRKVGWQVSPSLLGDMLKFGTPLIPSRIGLMLGFVSNRFFLRWFGSADPATALAQIGLFSLGHKFGVIVNRFINAPFNSFWSPRRMELLLDGVNDSRQTVARVCTYATFCSIFCGLLISAAIANVVEIMADPSYKGAHIVVPFVILSYIALGLENHFITGILYCKKTQWTTYVTFLSLLVIVVWNYIFIPRFGLIGAATSNFAGYALRLTLIYLISQRLYPIPFELGRMAAMSTVALGLYVTSQMITFHSPYLNFFVRTSIVATLPLFLYSLGFFHKGERQFIHNAIRKGGNFMKVTVQSVIIR